MDDNCGEWVECMGVASRSEVESMGVVSRRWMWVESMGVVVRRYIDYLILLTPLVSVLFCSNIPTFCSFLNCFSFLFQYFL